MSNGSTNSRRFSAGLDSSRTRNIPDDKVYIGATVELLDLEKNRELTYTLVSPEEADFEQGKISTVSPIGKGLLGHQEGEEVEIQVPVGRLYYKIVSISR